MLIIAPKLYSYRTISSFCNKLIGNYKKSIHVFLWAHLCSQMDIEINVPDSVCQQQIRTVWFFHDVCLLQSQYLPKIYTSCASRQILLFRSSLFFWSVQLSCISVSPSLAFKCKWLVFNLGWRAFTEKKRKKFFRYFGIFLSDNTCFFGKGNLVLSIG